MNDNDLQYLSYSNLPESLVHCPQWVCWHFEQRDGSKAAKIPVDPRNGSRIDVTVSGAGTHITEAFAYHAETDADGVGFVFTAEDPFVGIDLDDCVTADGILAGWAHNVVEAVDTYTEFSPSGRGVHCLCKGNLPEGNARDTQIELYEDERYFTVTGNMVSGCDSPKILDRTIALATVYYSLIGSGGPEESGDCDTHPATALPTGGGNNLPDDEVREKARTARNGHKFERLWAGETDGYPSHSEADNALCAFLAFWTGGDVGQIDRLFRKSGLYRAKWDEPRGDQTYGELTISAALDQTEDYYGN